MKRIRYIAVAFFVAVASQGCTLLDIAPDGRKTLDEIFADHYETAAFLNTCYQHIPAKGFQYYWVCNAPTALSDEGYLTFGTLADAIPCKMYQGSATATSHPIRDNNGQDYYATYMLQLRQCTTFLHYIDNANVHTKAERDRWRAEAHVLRAYYMSELLKWFGAFAYEPKGYTDDYNYANLQKRTVWELAQLIDAECTAAIDTPELPWRIESSNDRLRMTKALAWCIKSKMYLFAASPLHSEDYTDSEIKAHWDTAFEVNQKAVDALEKNGYALKTRVSNSNIYTGPAAAYQELFTSSSLTSADDPETIWQGTGNLSALSHNYIGSNTWLNSTRAGVVPTQEMVDAYEVVTTDGNGNITQAVPLLQLSRPYNADKSPNYNPDAQTIGFDPDDPYAVARDPRMGVCIIKNGDQVYWNDEMKTVETFVGGENGINDNSSVDRFTRTGYYFRKYVAPNADPINNISSAPWKYFRLAEIKLNLAEAAAEAGKLKIAEAQVNAIRARVGMPPLPDNLSQEEMILRVRQERMVELVYEECRYFDVRRWAESYQSSAHFQDFNLRCSMLTAMRITKDSETGELSYERVLLTSELKPYLPNASTRPRDLLLPIPETEAATLYALTNRRWQNAGW